jgi:hypothetical protein
MVAGFTLTGPEGAVILGILSSDSFSQFFGPMLILVCIIRYE